MRIAPKLAAAFSVMTLLVAAVAAAGFLQLRTFDHDVQAFVGQSVPRIDTMQALVERIGQTATGAYQAFLTEAPEARSSALASLEQAKGAIGDMLSEMDRHFAGDDDPNSLELQSRIQNDNSSLLVALTKFSRFLGAGHVALAQSVLTGEVQPRASAMQATLKAYAAYEMARLHALQQETHQAYRQAAWLLGGIGLLAIGLASVLAWALTRSIVRPIGDAVRVAHAVSRGDLSVQAHSTARGEVGVLLRAMEVMVGTLQNFSAAQEQMARRHAAGDTDARIDVAAFRGAYGEMATKMNDLLDEHLSLQFRLVEVLRHYAVGDFSVEMPALPGKKAQLGDATAQARANLIAVSAEIARLSQAAAGGDFSQRGHSDALQHGFRDIVDHLNRLMEVADLGLQEVTRVLGAMAEGDLRTSIDVEFEGTFEQLKLDANRTTERLAAIVSGIRRGSEAIDRAAREISSGNLELAQCTDLQGQALATTSGAIRELSDTVHTTAGNTQEATRCAGEAARVVAAGDAAVAEVVTTMDRIQEASGRISDITSLIDSIAFQTNILALNAAVEAARAGEQGRGFAVVASEVRNLAQRSAQSAREIKTLIEQSEARVAEGSDRARQAGETMRQVRGSVERVSQLMCDIEAATQAQGQGLEQVHQAIARMDEVTQQSAALVEQVSAAARSMTEQTSGLSQSVAVFRLADVPVAPRPAVPEQRAA